MFLNLLSIYSDICCTFRDLPNKKKFCCGKFDYFGHSLSSFTCPSVCFKIEVNQLLPLHRDHRCGFSSHRTSPFFWQFPSWYVNVLGKAMYSCGLGIEKRNHGRCSYRFHILVHNLSVHSKTLEPWNFSYGFRKILCWCILWRSCCGCCKHRQECVVRKSGEVIAYIPSPLPIAR